MNFMDCTLGTENGGVGLHHAAFSMPLSSQHSQALPDSSAQTGVVLGIRPDDVSISSVPTANETIKGEVLVTELLGGDLLVEAQINETRVTVKTDPGYQADMGDACYLGLDATRWHLFDNDTGAAHF